MKHCSWCDHAFDNSVTYQIYCSAECRDAATKEKIAARYMQTRRQNRKGKERNCKNCGSPLSIYNDDPICYQCQINPGDVAKALKDLKRLSNGKE